MPFKRHKSLIFVAFTIAVVCTAIWIRIDAAVPFRSDFRTRLVDLAFQSASTIPVEPHVKDRTKTQEAAALAALKLDRPDRALRYAEKIEGWRRGSVYAETAQHYAKKGLLDKAGHYLDLAGQVAEETKDWHREVIEERIGQVRVYVERKNKPSPEEQALRDQEFDDEVKKLDEAVATGEFDAVHKALWAYVALFEIHYDDAPRRLFSENKVKDSWKSVPPVIRMDLLLKMAELALNHADQAEALRIVNDAQQVFGGAEWPAEYGVPLMARLAGLRFRAGDTERARADNDAALTLFDAKRETIEGIFRPDVLHPVAAAYHAMGDEETALKVYRKALEEGGDNPNARPRALNLSSTCLSMAVHGVTPDAGLWSRMRQLKQGLRDPW